MGLFGIGGEKSSGIVTNYGADQVGMMKMLAGMPQMMRKPMMQGRLNQLLALNEESHQESIREMIGAFHSPKVKDKARKKLVTTRVEIISEFPEDKRRIIMLSRASTPSVAPKLEGADRQLQERVLPKVAAPARAAFNSTWTQIEKAKKGEGGYAPSPRQALARRL